LFAKAALVDHERLAAAQQKADIITAEGCLQDAFASDVRPAIRAWRVTKGLPENPQDAFRQSGYLERAVQERGARNMSNAGSYA